jgi:hypothetical protein
MVKNDKSCGIKSLGAASMRKGKQESRSGGQPKGALTITTYEELERYLRAFAAGHLNLVILVGAAGLAKSRTVKGILGERACNIQGNATPFGIYEKLFRHRDQFIVIDDVDSLYADRSGIRLLKCLCQTDPEKVVAWHSDARSLERRGIPREFTTSSRVIIIANDWRTLNNNVAALQDRGHVLLFKPTALEVHRKADEWFSDPEVYNWFRENLHRVREPSLRHFVRARELKLAGMDFTHVLDPEGENLRARIAAQVLASMSYPTTREKVAAFMQHGGGCRATFFNYRRKLNVSTEPPRSWDHQAPPNLPAEEDHNALMRLSGLSGGERGVSHEPGSMPEEPSLQRGQAR